MSTDYEAARFVGYRKFKAGPTDSGTEGVYEFVQGERFFYLDRDGLRNRLQRLINSGEAHDATSKALSLHE